MRRMQCDETALALRPQPQPLEPFFAFPVAMRDRDPKKDIENRSYRIMIFVRLITLVALPSARSAYQRATFYGQSLLGLNCLAIDPPQEKPNVAHR